MRTWCWFLLHMWACSMFCFAVCLSLCCTSYAQRLCRGFNIRLRAPVWKVILSRVMKGPVVCCFYQVKSSLELKHVTRLGSLVHCAAPLEGSDSGGRRANFSPVPSVLSVQAGHLSSKENGSWAPHKQLESTQNKFGCFAQNNVPSVQWSIPACSHWGCWKEKKKSHAAVKSFRRGWAYSTCKNGRTEPKSIKRNPSKASCPTWNFSIPTVSQ